MKDMQDANPMLQETPNDTPAEAKQPEPAAKDGIDRRNFLSCMAWAGTGLVWTIMGGVPTSKLFAATAGAAGKMRRMPMRDPDSALFRSATAISVSTRRQIRMWQER